MKSEESFEPGASERFVDAALEEQSRLCFNNGDDSELVYRILLNTVNRPAKAKVASQQKLLDRKLLLTGVGAITALTALIVAVLSQMPFQQKSESADEYHFVVQLRDSFSERKASETAELAPQIPGRAYSNDLAFSKPASRFQAPIESSLDPGLSIPLQFDLSFKSLPQRPHRYDHFTVTAEKSEKCESQIRLLGSVQVVHADFRIEAEDATIQLDEESGRPIRILARNSRVFSQSSDATVDAGMVVFDPTRKTLELSNVTASTNQRFAGHEWKSDDLLIISGSESRLIPVHTGASAAIARDEK